tara:strand:+ start:15994 stop:16260 length:267 start_codon:yes stop_codon:yes gene_type:complete
LFGIGEGFFEAWFLFGKMISNESGKKIRQEVFGTLMAGMFNLEYVFELVNSGFTNGSFAQHDRIRDEGQQVGFHIFAEFSNQVNALKE